MKSEHQKRVETFLHGIGRDVPTRPQVVDNIVRHLWSFLLLEETLEVLDAAGFALRVAGSEKDLSIKDLVLNSTDKTVSLEKLAKELADVSVVMTGFFSLCGIDAEKILEIVDENNILKVKTGYRDKETGKFMKAPDHPSPLPAIQRNLTEQGYAGEPVYGNNHD